MLPLLLKPLGFPPSPSNEQNADATQPKPQPAQANTAPASRPTVPRSSEGGGGFFVVDLDSELTCEDLGFEVFDLGFGIGRDFVFELVVRRQ